MDEYTSSDFILCIVKNMSVIIIIQNKLFPFEQREETAQTVKGQKISF